MLSSEAFVQRNTHTAHVLVVGHYSERHEDRLYELAERAICINNDNQCRPGQVRDGFFPDVVFADPNFVMPVLNLVLLERLFHDKRTVSDLMSRLETMDGAGKEAVHGAHTLKAMLCDPDCTIFMTMSGAMTIAKMQRLPVQLIETGRIAYLAATGALIGHGLVEGSGCQHFKYDPRFTDEELAEEGLNRVSDTIEPEGNFDHIEKIVRRVLQKSYPRKQRGPHITQSSAFYRDLGAYLHRHYPDAASVLSSAYRQDVAVVTPAVVDSELANDVFVENARRGSRARIIFDQELDTGVLFDLATKAKRLGIFTIGGGVPRNNTQNVAPLIEIYNERMRKKLPPGRFFYGCRID
ncbi:MAG: deoxyhypusine synthase family protein, partial [bacterium]|nr:deoxyhypusine synthase family protein [bacterium]